MTKKQKKNRLLWAKEHRTWCQNQWDSIIWSVEARFEVCVGDNQSRVIRTKAEVFHNDCLKKKVKFPASVMIWGSMSAKGIGKLHFVEGIMNADKYIYVLKNNLKPQIEEMRLNDIECIFQQDGAACHTAKKVKAWMIENNISLLKWTSSSPDLSPIETLWHIMKKKLREQPARTVLELRARLQEIWNNFTPDDCQKLVDTMPRRIQAVISHKGDVTQW